MKKSIFILMFFLMIGICVCLKLTAAQEKTAETSEDAANLEQKVLSFVIEGHTPKGVKQWHLEGNSAEIKGDEIYLEDLKAVVYGDELTVNLTSKRGIYYKEKGNVELIEDVVVISSDGSVLTTDRAIWSQITKDISSDTKIRIKQKEMIAIGDGGTANSDKKTAMLKKNVVVLLKPKTKVRCDGPLKVRYNENIAVFHNNVHVRDKDGELFADKLIVKFDPETRKLAQAVGKGNARVRKGKSYTVSEMVVYTETTKSAKLIGKPRVVIAPEELSASDEGANYEVKSIKEL